MKISDNRYSEFDFVASRYDKGKASLDFDEVIDQLEKLLLQYLPMGSHILDIGCGTGQIAKRLLEKNYQITGIDGSEEMLQYARHHAPTAEFILEDMRFFNFPPTFNAVISTDVALNYITSFEELKSAFKNVYNALLTNGMFVGEISLEEEGEAYDKIHMYTDITDDYVIAVRMSYDSENKVIQDFTTKFELIDGNWQRSDTTFFRKLYSKTEIQSALENIGFTQVSIYELKQDLGIEKVINGRACCICHKS